MSDAKEQYWDNLLGGFAIVLLGILISASSVWGVVENVYSMSWGAAPALFFILGVGTILIGTFIILNKPEAQTVAA